MLTPQNAINYHIALVYFLTLCTHYVIVFLSFSVLVLSCLFFLSLTLSFLRYFLRAANISLFRTETLYCEFLVMYSRYITFTKYTCVLDMTTNAWLSYFNLSPLLRCQVHIFKMTSW